MSHQTFVLWVFLAAGLLALPAAAQHTSTEPADAAPDELAGAAPDDRPTTSSDAELAYHTLAVVGAVALGGVAATVATGAAQLGLFGTATGFALLLGNALPANLVGAVEVTLLIAGVALTFAPPLAVAAAATFASWWAGGRFWWTVGLPAAVVGALGFPLAVLLGGVATLAVVANTAHLLYPPGAIRTGYLELALVAGGGMVGGLVGSGLIATAAAAAFANGELLAPVVDSWAKGEQE